MVIVCVGALVCFDDVIVRSQHDIIDCVRNSHLASTFQTSLVRLIFFVVVEMAPRQPRQGYKET